MKNLIAVLSAICIISFLTIFAANAYVEATTCKDDFCFGQQFAKYNDLKTVDQCNFAKKPYFEHDASLEFLAGCRDTLNK